MPSWILFSILAAVAWAVANTADKCIIANLVKKPIVLVVFMGIISLLASLVIYFSRGFAELSPFNILLSIFAGGAYVLMILFYFLAVKIDEISRVVPLSFLSPLFILIFAALFLGEILAPANYLGVFFLVMGAILISSKDLLKFNFNRSLWLMIISAFAFSIYAIITKYLLGYADYWTIFSYVRIGVFLVAIPIIYFNFPELILAVKEKGGAVSLGLVSLNETIRLSGGIFITAATAAGSVTLVNTLAAVQLFFVLLLTTIINAAYPRILKEQNGGSAIFVKLAAVIFMFIGVILIT